MKKLMPKLKGFTIIEVIIVLVIGAVIMLAVFLVVPQLQRQNRESQMRQIAQRVLVAARQIQQQGGDCANKIADYNNTATQNNSLTVCIKDIIGLYKNPVSNLEYTYYTNRRPANYQNYMYAIRNAKCTNNALESGSESIAVTYSVEPYDRTLPDNPGVLRCISD
jgi:prepilin-type N-terminal cleavage/methylation domain-containing protein